MTLTETATFTKRFLRVVAIFGGAFLTLWIVFLFLYQNVYKPYLHSIAKPQKAFKALPQPDLPASLISSTSLNYSLDTSSGFLPAGIPRLVNVYFITPQETDLGASKRAKKLADNLGFTAGPDILTPSRYKFGGGAGGELVVSLNSGNFEYSRPVSSTQTQEAILPDGETLISSFRQYLDSFQLLKNDLKKSRASVIFDNSDRTVAKSATVSIWQDDIDNLPIVTPNPDHGLIQATVASPGADSSLRYIRLRYTYWPIDHNTASTYEVKPVAKAFDELKMGLATVVKSSPVNPASITKVYLAYFLPDQYTPYLQPVYVFEGPQFTAYVKALTDDSYTQ